jgi:hypothetical protein
MFFKDAYGKRRFNAINKVDDEKPNVVAKQPHIKKRVEKQLFFAEKNADEAIPHWFNPRINDNLIETCKSNYTYLYIPWIYSHSDILISKIKNNAQYRIEPFDFIIDTYDAEVRKDVLRFARTNPTLYKKMVRNKLVQICANIKGLIFTFDWVPAIRIIVDVCEELDILTILIPHESVFFDSDKYYYDIEGAQASVPVADTIWGWGEIQNNIFAGRGYPEERLEIVGSPKLDQYKNYKPKITKEQFCRIYGLENNKSIILFATQYLDNQLDRKVALEAQRQGIKDVAEYCKLNNCQMILRFPPNDKTVLNNATREAIKDLSFIVFDEANCYLTSPEESIYHSDIIISLNSTMLFEGVLLSKKSISIRYLDFSSIWSDLVVPVAKTKEQLFVLLNKALSQQWHIDSIELDKLAHGFGVGTFDGLAGERIKNNLANIAVGNKKITKYHRNERLFFDNKIIDVACIPTTKKVLETSQLYLKDLLQARTLLTENDLKVRNIASVDVFFQWGITTNDKKMIQKSYAKALNKPTIILEDGFIRSVNIGLSSEPSLSIMYDNNTAYYDATKASQLENLLNSDIKLDKKTISHCKKSISKIVTNRVSKYNHAPYYKLSLGSPDRKKILLVDQRHGDASVQYGLGSDESFSKMLQDALSEYGDCDIIIKQHPDAITGGKQSYFNEDLLSPLKYANNVFLYKDNINPYALFDLVEDVFVCSSGMGFEALMAGKKVHCYGMPFYAGWGVTNDKIVLERRSKKRSMEEIFYFAYIILSRYWNPDENRIVGVDEIVDYIVKYRKN